MCLLYPQKKHINQKCLLKLFLIDCYIISQFPAKQKVLSIFLGHPWTVRVSTYVQRASTDSFQVVSLLPCGMKQLTGLKKSKVFWFETSRNRKNATNAWYNTHRYTTCKWLVRRFFWWGYFIPFVRFTHRMYRCASNKIIWAVKKGPLVV